MYTNIKTGPALHRIGQFARKNKEDLTVPPAVLMDALRLLMTNNVFQFGYTYWVQKVGTAMGAPPAPPWATIFFGVHKETVIAQFGDKLQLHRRLPRPGRRSPTMDVVCSTNARLLRVGMDI